MDKYEIVFDIIEHPERYSDDQIKELFADKEIAETYNLVCKIHASVKSNSSAVNVDDEWQRFSKRYRLQSKPDRRPILGRVAAIAVVSLSSIVALALGLAVKNSFISKESNITAYAKTQDEAIMVPHTVSADSINEDIPNVAEPILFEDATLEDIMQIIGRHYGMEVRFRNDAAASLRLYYKFEPDHTIEETIESLNVFDGINIIIDDNMLFVDR